nr:MAG TPA: minor tail protein [Caudoviricetes sp.]
MSDGSIIISTDLDNKALERKLSRLRKDIEALEQSVSGQETKKGPLVQQAQELEQKIKAVRAEVEKYQADWVAGVAGADKNQSAAIQNAVQLENEHAKVVAQIKKIDDKLLPASEKLEAMKEEAGGLEQELAGVAGKANRDVSPALSEITDRMDKFTNRVKSLARRVFVFTLITSAMRGMRTWLWNVVKTNEKATAAVAQLKGALLTLAQPLINVVIPAFTAFVNALAKLASAAAGLVSGLFGTTIDESAKAAESLYEEQKALSGVGSAAKKAGKSLASFDEINKLSSENSSAGGGGAASSSGVAPDFSQVVSDGLTSIVEMFTGAALLAIGAILTFTGANVLLGLGLMAIGALAMYDAVTSNPEIITEMVDSGLNLVLQVIGPMIAVIGVILAVSGHLLLGLGLIVAGISIFEVGASAGEGGDFVSNIKGRLAEAATVIGASIAVIGVLLICTGSILTGIALLLLGISIFEAASVADDGGKTLSEKIITALSRVAFDIGMLIAVLGIVLMLVPGKLALGIGMLIAGIALFAIGEIGMNSDVLKQDIVMGLSNILGAIGPFLFVIGLVLMFVPGMQGFGFGMMLAGIAMTGVSSILPNWDFILEELRGAWTRIKDWWKDTVLGGLSKARDAVVNWGSGIIDKVKNVLGIHSPSTETYSMGEYMMQGMENGITENKSAVTGAFQTVLDGMRSSFDAWEENFESGWLTFQTLFKRQWKAFWSGIHVQFIISWNDTLSAFQQGINNAVTALNELVSSANELAGLTGEKYSYINRINIPQLKIPRLATGAVIPPNREFLAVLGDQKSGTNIETPLSTMVQAFKQALNETGYSGGRVIENVVLLDGEVIYRNQQKISRQHGMSFARG